jgi:hypothetical protein
MTDHQTESTLRVQRGMRFEPSDAATFRAAIEAAVNYRGDVSLTLASTGEAIEGYLYDFARPNDPERAAVRIIPADGSPRRTIAISDLAALAFTGRDTAEGKSFETWVRKYVEKKLKGEAANIESEPLNDA